MVYRILALEAGAGENRSPSLYTNRNASARRESCQVPCMRYRTKDLPTSAWLVGVRVQPERAFAIGISLQTVQNSKPTLCVLSCGGPGRSPCFWAKNGKIIRVLYFRTCLDVLKLNANLAHPVLISTHISTKVFKSCLN